MSEHGAIDVAKLARLSKNDSCRDSSACLGSFDGGSGATAESRGDDQRYSEEDEVVPIHVNEPDDLPDLGRPLQVKARAGVSADKFTKC
jgi:hypothetical protein